MKLIHRLSLFIAWLIALTALLVTLYLNEVMHFPVCTLCWYQRICIYPLVILLGIGLLRRETDIPIYTIPLSILAFIFAAYQYCEQMIASFGPIQVCSPTGPACSDIYIQWMGFVTIPFFGMIATLTMTILLFLARKTASNNG